MRHLLTRTLAYCLSFEEGISWSKGGVSSADEPAIAVRDAAGALRVWIDIGAPSAERLHKATKAAERVVLYTHVDPRTLRREAASRAIHRVSDIEVWRVDPELLDKVEAVVDRNAQIVLTRNEGHLYLAIGKTAIEGRLERVLLT
jgi:uncharacterized protein YaeQ